MNALPKPDWGREGETWRIEPEDAVPWRTDLPPLLCRHNAAQYGAYEGRCHNRAVAGFTSRSGEFHPRCEQHLRPMWIEDGVVVSWRLSK